MDLRPIVESVDLEASRWVETVRRDGQLYYREAGRVESLRAKAEAIGQWWLAGVRMTRGVFRTVGVAAG